MDKKKAQGALHLLPASAISVVFLVIVVALGVLILAGMNSSLISNVTTGQSSNPAATNLISQGMTGLSTYGSWFSTIVIVIIAVVIISLLTGFFYAKGKMQQ